MKRVHLVTEVGGPHGDIVWGAFRKRKQARKFREREFQDHPNVCLREVKVYKSLRRAPSTDEWDSLRHAEVGDAAR